MDRNISPEEKLLRLIRGRPKKEAQKEASVVSSAQKERKIRLNYLKPLESFFKTRLLNFLSFKTLNVFLVSLLIMFSTYSLVNLLNPAKPRTQEDSRPAEETQKQQEIKISKPKDYDYYYKQFSKRDIFNAPLTPDKTEASNVSASLKEATKNFKLVGVILGKQPQAIIEDKATKMTHFLNKGDSLDKIQVKDILESKVILSSAGEDIELSL